MNYPRRVCLCLRPVSKLQSDCVVPISDNTGWRQGKRYLVIDRNTIPINRNVDPRQACCGRDLALSNVDRLRLLTQGSRETHDDRQQRDHYQARGISHTVYRASISYCVRLVRTQPSFWNNGAKIFRRSAKVNGLMVLSGTDCCRQGRGQSSTLYSSTADHFVVRFPGNE